MSRAYGLVIAVALCASVRIADAQPVISPPVPLTGAAIDKPTVFRSENGLSIRVVPLAVGLSHPTGMVFLPDGHTILLLERPEMFNHTVGEHDVKTSIRKLEATTVADERLNRRLD